MQDIIRHIAGPFTGNREWIDAEEHFGFQNGFITILGSGFSAKELMEYRQSILRLAEVLFDSTAENRFGAASMNLYQTSTDCNQ